MSQVGESPPKLGGVAARTKKFQVPYAQTGWLRSETLHKCIPKGFGLGTNLRDISLVAATLGGDTRAKGVPQ